MSELLAAVLATARAEPGRVAVVEPARSTTYGALVAAAAGFADDFRRRGVRPGDRVGVVLPPGADLVAAALAAFGRRAAYVPIDPALPPRRIDQILDACAPRTTVTAAVEATGAPEFDRPALDDVAYVISTSGSTGTPKAVEIEHRSLLNVLEDLDELAPVEIPYTGSWWTSPTFDVSLWECWSPLRRGGTVAIVPPEARIDAASFAGFLHARGVHSAYVPPGLLTGFRDALAADPGLVPGLARLLVGVEPIPLGLLQELLRLRDGLRIVNGYGPAEATIYCARYLVPRTGGHPSDRTPIGTATRGVTLHLDDENGTGSGEIVVAGVNVGRGYLGGDPDGRFRPLPDGRRAYRTGDLARVLPDGTLVFEGRRDRQLKIRGVRIEAGEVEAAIREAVPVREVVVAPRDGALAAYLVPARGDVVDPVGVRRALLGVLPAAAVPSVIVALEALPQTANGKTDHTALARLAAPAPPTVHTRTDDAWRAVNAAVGGALGDFPDPAHGFLESGGTSLTAVSAAVALSQASGRAVTAHELLTARTLGDLADALSTYPPATEPGDDGITGRTEAPLTPAQLGVWMHDQLDPGSTRYLETYCVDLPGADPDRLAAALARATGAHPAFRATVHDTGDEVVLSLPPPGASGGLDERYSVPDRQAAIEAATVPARRPMDLAAGPLLRTAWITYPPDHGLLVLVWHHLVIDGWSLRLFLTDLARAYADPDYRPAPAASTICDATVRATARAGTEQSVDAVESLVARLASGGITLGLRSDRDRSRPADAGHLRAATAGYLRAELSRAASAALRTPGGASPFVRLLDAYRSALARTFGLTSFVLGCADGRARAVDAGAVAGYLVDTRLLISDDPLPEALDRPLVPLPALVRRLRRVREVPESFPSLYYAADEGYVLGLAGAREVDLPPGQAKFDLTLDVRHTAGRFTLRLTWDPAVVSTDEAQRVLDAVQQEVTPAPAPCR
ncbi:AMP-binding protein [Cryptosporangium phraense]|uniref:AMP-binding protein n=1 Tax=Cryptosporangium phraense TaxID=2593070 RepID=UPI001478A472|nr:AMP-binding protein [Cryptosporangium phraense]